MLRFRLIFSKKRFVFFFFYKKRKELYSEFSMVVMKLMCVLWILQLITIQHLY